MHWQARYPDKLKTQNKLADLKQTRIHMVERHRDARALLHQTQQKRHIAEVRVRAGSLPTGLKAIWFKLSGQYKHLIITHQLQAEQCEARDRLERQNLIESQLGERRNLQKQILSTEETLKQLESYQSQTLVVDPEQALVIPPDPDALSIKEKVNQNAEYILEVLTDKQESFTRNDMTSTKQLLRFVKEAKRSGAKLLLVGDPEQLQPINAGTPFKDICQTINPAKLTEIHRQKEDWQKQASLDLAEQRIGEALKAYELHDKVVATTDTSEVILRLVEDYMVDLEFNGNRSSRIALAHRRKDVHAINQAIRQARKTAGDLSEVDETLIRTDHGKRAFAKGDHIVFTKNDKALGVRNGMLGTVKSIAEATETNGAIELIVHIDGKPNKTITIDPTDYTAIDHGYATTIHKSQGVTVDHAFVLGSPTMDRHLTYVAMTRHRHDAILYGDFSTLQNIRKVNNPQSKFTFNEQRRPTGIKSLKTQNRRPTMH